MNCHRELTLSGLLSDPLVRAVMEADSVNPCELEEMLRRVAQGLRISQRPKSSRTDAAVPIPYSVTSPFHEWRQ